MKRRAKLYRLTPDITVIDDAGVSLSYVVCGEKHAAVIDTVNGFENLKDIVREITDLPLIVINTHGHCDHVWGNSFFEEAYLHPADIPVHDLHFKQKKEVTWEEASKAGALKEEWLWFKEQGPCKLLSMLPGDIFDLGGRKLEVVGIPGHTPGSVALLDDQTGFFFVGDAINEGLWMQLPESTKLQAYLDTLHTLDVFRPRIKELHTGHNIPALPVDYIDTMIAGIEKLIQSNGAGDGESQWFGGIAKQHFVSEHAFLLYTEDKLIP